VQQQQQQQQQRKSLLLRIAKPELGDNETGQQQGCNTR
jgi:hypothetical protein